MRTYAPKPQDIERGWYVVDAQDAVLGRLATEVAAILRGKHKPIWAPNADVGDHVIVVNAAGIQLSGDKGNKKGPLDGVGAKIKADEIRGWLTDAKGMTAKTKATRKPEMKAYTLPKEDVDALVAYLSALK